VERQLRNLGGVKVILAAQQSSLGKEVEGTCHQ